MPKCALRIWTICLVANMKFHISFSDDLEPHHFAHSVCPHDFSSFSFTQFAISCWPDFSCNCFKISSEEAKVPDQKFFQSYEPLYCSYDLTFNVFHLSMSCTRVSLLSEPGTAWRTSKIFVASFLISCLLRFFPSAHTWQTLWQLAGASLKCLQSQKWHSGPHPLIICQIDLILPGARKDVKHVAPWLWFHMETLDAVHAFTESR